MPRDLARPRSGSPSRRRSSPTVSHRQQSKRNSRRERSRSRSPYSSSYSHSRSHLPEKDITMTLEDEGGRQLQSKYIACKTGLGAGWRQFVASHKLLEGDVLVFQLVEPAKFKVHIIRSNDFSEGDGAHGIHSSNAQSKRNDADKDDVDTCTPSCNEPNR